MVSAILQLYKRRSSMKVAVVTGGSRGIGASICMELSRNGYRVVINYNKSEKEAEKVLSSIEKEGGEGCIFKADVSKEEDVKKMFEYILEEYKTVDLLVNNAGKSLQNLITYTDVEEWDDIIDTNLKSVFLCSKEALKIMVSNHSGKIINMSSMWGVTGGSCEVIYSASKAGVIGFTKALAKEVGPSNITVNAVAPGVIMTDMMSGFSDEDIKNLSDETPLMRVGSPKDIANIVVYLASEKADFITGQIIGVNGGICI